MSRVFGLISCLLVASAATALAADPVVVAEPGLPASLRADPAATPPAAAHRIPADLPPRPAKPAETTPPDPEAEARLQAIVRRQQTLFAQASGDEPKVDDDEFKHELQQISFDYESLLTDHPTAKGYAAYGYFLGKIDMRRQSIAMLLKSNERDPNQPFVKNQIGNYLAEEGQPLEAVSYFLAAIQLKPDEPLYHYQLGTLLHEARADFLKSGQWSRADLDRTTHEAFHRAAELAPDRIEFTYRYAESFYDLENPDWDAALKEWHALEEKAGSNVERETMRLHIANIFLKTNRPEQARLLLATVHEPALDEQKEKLVAQLSADGKK
ncbi:hypothetical protein K0B96_01130 [Horticoccus luteus]|uniref:Tetratricopeptide repeat protein n=1 Tax=Horticoccus luteus TaxID=2862869 RepID=A0A8F9TW74_9BACT|nr:hypothetical protein [Horticoccus luteus]QYM79250.1 hypothetical protein K0B96_01130 [Horticoccus luteus]